MNDQSQGALIPIRDRRKKQTIYVDPSIVTETKRAIVVGNVRLQHSLYNCSVIEKNVVGYCLLHKANISINQMKKKQCCEKQCKWFCKKEAANYWANLERKREAKRSGKKKRKEREAQFVAAVLAASKTRSVLGKTSELSLEPTA
ncbi:hypothetical protein FACS1894109_02480 [Spirochaetia bacterium]|nr:hypothetical protein FACS1894109_02480 [Spirochaetia bacterium]